MPKQVQTTYAFLPEWVAADPEDPLSVELWPYLAYFARWDITHVQPTHPGWFRAFGWCGACDRPLSLSERQTLYGSRHVRHFWREYRPIWKQARHQAKEQSMEVLTGVFIGLMTALVVIYLGWLYWQSVRGMIK
jgi:hypothetical protein